jgi:Zn-dependent protease/CBS domain-containing protein
MKWAWRVARVSGVDIYLHGTFLILLAWVALSHLLEGHSVTDAAAGLGFVTTIFGIVVLHELGHALTAQRFGIRTRDITLLPIGGVATLERMPEEPWQELLVALAGPAVNVVLAALLFAALVPIAGPAAVNDVALVGGTFLAKLIWLNVGLAVFNLFPAFPMDGGRALRAILAMRLDYVQATLIAASIGQGGALLLGFVGLFSNPFLVFVALFVWIGAAGEASFVQMKSALHGVPISKAMVTEFRTLSPADSLASALDHITAGFQNDFPVVDAEGRIVGVLTRASLLAALPQRGIDATVAEAMERDFEIADPREMAEDVFVRLQGNRCHSLPVMNGGRVVGMVTMESVGELLALRAAFAPRTTAN